MAWLFPYTSPQSDSIKTLIQIHKKQWGHGNFSFPFVETFLGGESKKCWSAFNVTEMNNKVLIATNCFFLVFR